MARVVPFYAQTAEFSCGPACAVMVLAHFNGVRPTRELEFEVWRQCNLVGVRGADPWGLAVPLLQRGYQVRLVADRFRFVPLRLVSKRFTKEEADLMHWAHKGNMKRARALGLEEARRRPRIAEMAEALKAGELPLALVDMGHLHKEPGIPHWNVVTAVDEEHVTVNDPYLPTGGPGRRVPRQRFTHMMDEVVRHLDGPRAALFVFKKRRGRTTR